MKKLFLRLIESYILVLGTALAAGLLFPDQLKFINPWTTLFLQIIFFLSSLKLNLAAISKELHSWKTVTMVNLYMLIIFPLLGYLVTQYLAPDYAIAIFLLAAMPAGMTSPLLTELVGGSVALALVLTTATSLLSPFTIPLLTKLVLGNTIALPYWHMVWSLIYVIVIPFALAQILKYFANSRIQKSFYTFKPISILLLGLLIAGVVSTQASALRANINQFLYALAVLIPFFASLHIFGYWGIPGLKRDQRLAATICLTYMNFTLAIYIAGKFFPDPKILVPVILSVFPWSLSIVPLKILIKNQRKPL